MFATTKDLLEHIRFDEQTVPGASMQDLNPNLWKRFRTTISPKNDQEFLEAELMLTIHAAKSPHGED